MAHKTIKLVNNHNGNHRYAPVGFSWTVLLFGLMVPLYRGDVKWIFMMLFCAAFTMGFSNILFAFTYNRSYIRNLKQNGYTKKEDCNENKF